MWTSAPSVTILFMVQTCPHSVEIQCHNILLVYCCSDLLLLLVIRVNNHCVSQSQIPGSEFWAIIRLPTISAKRKLNSTSIHTYLLTLATKHYFWETNTWKIENSSLPDKEISATDPHIRYTVHSFSTQSIETHLLDWLLSFGPPRDSPSKSACQPSCLHISPTSSSPPFRAFTSIPYTNVLDKHPRAPTALIRYEVHPFRHNHTLSLLLDPPLRTERGSSERHGKQGEVHPLKCLESGNECHVGSGWWCLRK